MNASPIRNALPAVVLAAVLLVAAGAVPASAASDGSAREWTSLRESIRYRFDLDLMRERLTPQDLYGNWHSATATLYVRTLPRITPFVQVGVLEREDEDLGFGCGAYADIAPRLYTYTAFTRGGRSRYTQRHRWDHLFHWNAGPAILILGGSWGEDWNGHEDRSLTFGPRVWRGAVIAEYRATLTRSDPGGHTGWTHALTGGWGEEGRVWLFITLTAGDQRYTATWVTPHQPVHHDFQEVSVSYQRWLAPRLGLKLQGSWLDLGEELDGYEKLGVGVGGFLEF